MIHPAFIAHADWGTDRKKRQVAVANRTTDGRYRVVSLGAALSKEAMRGDLASGLNVANQSAGQLFAGFDFPIGLPRAYAELVGVDGFTAFLRKIGQGEWADFSMVASRPDEVGLHRPFYPARPGGTSPFHLYQGLGLDRAQLRRRCDGSDAETMFWTLGGKQVGKAALSGWDYLKSVANGRIRFWPFDGELTTLLNGDPGITIVAETYPREFYKHFRVGTSGKKSRREDRLLWIPGLFRWADQLGVTWAPAVVERVEAGFADNAIGEDEFDATVGLLGMIAVVAGVLASGEPSDDTAVLSIEGWMLGRRTAAATESVVLQPMPLTGRKPELNKGPLLERLTIQQLVEWGDRVGLSDEDLRAVVTRTLNNHLEKRQLK